MKRNTNIEILRFVLMVFIFCWHIIVHGYCYVEYWTGERAIPLVHAPLGVIEFFSVLFAPATYCFMFISGFYGMKYTYKRHFAIELWLIIIAWGVFLFHLFYYSQHNITVESIIPTIFPVLGKKWWFMTEYMLIYFISPIINKGLANISKHNFSFIIILFIGYNFLTFFGLSANAGSNFVGLFTIYLIGRYCYLYNVIPSMKLSWTIYASSLSILFITIMVTNILLPEFNKYWFPLLGYNTPCIMAMAISIFFIVYNLKAYYNVFINKFLKSVLFIYLITEGIGNYLYVKIAEELLERPFNAICLSVFVILFCIIIGHIVIVIQNKIQRIIAKKIDVLK